MTRTNSLGMLDSSPSLPFEPDFGTSVNSGGRTYSIGTSGANSASLDRLITAIAEFAKWIFCVGFIVSIFSKNTEKKPEVTPAIHNVGYNLHPTGWANIP